MSECKTIEVYHGRCNEYLKTLRGQLKVSTDDVSFYHTSITFDETQSAKDEKLKLQFKGVTTTLLLANIHLEYTTKQLGSQNLNPMGDSLIDMSRVNVLLSKSERPGLKADPRIKCLFSNSS